MTWKIAYSRHIDRRKLGTIPANDRKRIQKAIQEKLQKHPELFGKPLRKSLYGCRSLRVGNYRVIYVIEAPIVHILLIAHRSVVYKDGEGLM